MIPFGDLRRNHDRLRPEIDAAVRDVLDSGWYVLGDRLAAFERAFADWCGVEHAVGVGNGTDALALALLATGVAPGDEVVTSPLSAAFTALAISQIGAVPTFADIEPERLSLDPERLAAAITPRTRAVVPVHLYGQPADMAPILEIARDRDLAVVGDAAQAHGAAYRGEPVGALGEATAFSFYPSKNLGAYGDGGAVTTRDPGLALTVRMLRDGGQSARYQHELLGVNSRLDEIQAAILTVRLAYLDADNDRRRAIAARYTRALAGVAGISTPTVAEDVEHVFHLYVIRTPDRAEVAASLEAAGVATAVHYPTPIHRQPAYADRWPDGAFPVAERTAREVLSLPIYPELTDAEVETVASALESL